MARGGIDIAATFSYYVQPKFSIEGSVELPDIGSGSGSDTQLSKKEPTISSTSCLSLYDGWDIYGEIYPYYELRHVSISWSGIKVMDHTYHHNDRLTTCYVIIIVRNGLPCVSCFTQNPRIAHE